MDFKMNEEEANHAKPPTFLESTSAVPLTTSLSAKAEASMAHAISVPDSEQTLASSLTGVQRSWRLLTPELKENESTLFEGVSEQSGYDETIPHLLPLRNYAGQIPIEVQDVSNQTPSLLTEHDLAEFGWLPGDVEINCPERCCVQRSPASIITSVTPPNYFSMDPVSKFSLEMNSERQMSDFTSHSPQKFGYSQIVGEGFHDYLLPGSAFVCSSQEIGFDALDTVQSSNYGEGLIFNVKLEKTDQQESASTSIKASEHPPISTVADRKVAGGRLKRELHRLPVDDIGKPRLANFESPVIVVRQTRKTGRKRATQYEEFNEDQSDNGGKTVEDNIICGAPLQASGIPAPNTAIGSTSQEYPYQSNSPASQSSVIINSDFRRCVALAMACIRQKYRTTKKIRSMPTSNIAISLSANQYVTRVTGVKSLISPGTIRAVLTCIDSTILVGRLRVLLSHVTSLNDTHHLGRSLVDALIALGRSEPHVRMEMADAVSDALHLFTDNPQPLRESICIHAIDRLQEMVATGLFEEAEDSHDNSILVCQLLKMLMNNTEESSVTWESVRSKLATLIQEIQVHSARGGDSLETLSLHLMTL